MKTYIVGGAVRDSLLGLEPKDIDYVIVGATQQDIDEMISQGFQQVGADFPVFLHPTTGDEYALARVERKTGNGYGGFSTETDQVSLEDDLLRRDLTINAMAMDPDTKAIFDPYGGKSDLKNGILRHVSKAFAEDPLRVLRVARFAARYQFVMAPETIDLMSQIVRNDELEHLSAERVWVELEKLFSEKNSLIGLKALYLVGAIRHLFIDPNDCYVLKLTMMQNVNEYEQLSVLGKFIAIASGFKYDMQTMDEMRVPKHIQKAYLMFNKIVDRYSQFDNLPPEKQLQFMKDIDAFGNTTTFNDIKGVLAWSCGYEFNATTLNDKVSKAKSVDCAAIAINITLGPMKSGKQIAEDIQSARLLAIS